jgi:hypothetical protein
VRYKIVIAALGLVILYFASTWFFFGSPHPCEILLARQRGYYIKRAEQNSSEDLDFWRKLIKTALDNKAYDKIDEINKGYQEALDRMENVQVDVVQSLRRKIGVLTPSQCAWQAITWRAPSPQPK